jgi:hypothetical protein
LENEVKPISRALMEDAMEIISKSAILYQHGSRGTVTSDIVIVWASSGIVLNN